MSLLIAKKGETIIFMPDKQLDTNTSPEAEKMLMEQIDAGEFRIVIDLSKTDYMSSAGLRVILKTAMILQKKGDNFALCNGNEQVYEVLEFSGFLEIIKYFSSLEEAIKEVVD